MRKKLLANIQWRAMRMTAGLSLLLCAVFITLMLLYYGLDPMLLFSSGWFGIPFVVILLLASLSAGLISGYVYGGRLKTRMDTLIEAVLKFENGNFAYRVPPLGDDEIGLAADQLNEMAKRVELQVTSLQKLSNERAEWQDQMKKSVITEERQRLARDLHDAVSQQLFAISMMTSAVLEQVKDADDKIVKRIRMVEHMAGEAQNEMRALLLHLRPVTLEGKGLKEGLIELLKEFKAKQPLDIEWDISDTGVSKGVEDHLFRIVQEALSNVFRHSKATKVTVRLGAKHQKLQLKVIDNGAGFTMDQVKASSYGLHSIKERASEIGGIAEIISVKGKGTQIDVKVPIYQKTKGENDSDSSVAD
ncbi:MULTISPECIES: two-component system sensor histidine kinase LiaS [Bacillus]|uniref:Sensor histidine kinase n=1 Tax=Bacillus amyloliquefaciens (strain Y2) TaxID=1155777 RepID=I2CA10_BACAY|nr:MULTISPECIES: two-component system sensor histidine kinase LiaS [Bacillus]AFJ63484.1 sensor histidine kinase [Bacillus velezensis YAU B9601-Y2]AJE79980.1 histidine kinase [Bacillus sp. BH072]AUG37390.1 sensor histidine kinase [Bacillus velezensis]KFI15162.1 histidine kinase [Bacillus velezensis]KOC81632.1 histidine kinase [Bacillus velezensis]